MIIVENLTKKFGNKIVLSDINLHVHRKEITGIIGYNGCGKTVLIKCICGLLPFTKGSIFVANKRIGVDIDVPNNIGAIIESPSFLPNYNGFGNLLQLAMINRKIETKQVEESMLLVGLDPKSKKKVGKYSLGMKQRLGIAQAIMENPDILILDEPMNGLDKQGVLEIRKLLLELKKQGKTIVIVSHSSEDINALCDSVYEIENGKLTAIIN